MSDLFSDHDIRDFPDSHPILTAWCNMKNAPVNEFVIDGQLIYLRADGTYRQTPVQEIISEQGRLMVFGSGAE